MAEIKIEHRRRSAWVWLIALALLAFVAWFIANSTIGRRDGATTETRGGDVATAPTSAGVAPAAVATGAGAMPTAVSEYLAFADDSLTNQGADVDPNYSSQRLMRLVSAIEAVAVQDTVAGEALRPQLEELRQRAGALQRDPRAVAPALEAREAFLIAASLIDDMRERRFPSLAADATNVSDVAKTIDAELPLSEQIADVKHFFSRAGVALRGMTAAS